MTSPPQPESLRLDAATAALTGAVVLAALWPPEIYGSALAGAAALAALAALVTVLSGRSPAGAGWFSAAALLGTGIVRAAVAPGEAVEPVALALVVAGAGLTAAAAARRADPARRDAWVGAVAAGLTAVLGARGVYDAIWGLRAMATRVREAEALPDAAAILNRLEQGRAYGGFTTPAALGGFLVLVVPVAAAWSLSRKGATRILGLAATALGAAGLAATRSLTALAALGAALALAAIVRRVNGRLVGAALAVVGGTALAVALTRPDGVFSLVREDSPWRLRAGNVRVALEIAADHPWAGVGPGGYAELYPQYRRAGENETRFAHDLPAQLLAEFGVPAGAAFAALFYLVFVGPLLGRRAPPRSVSGLAAISLAAFALHGLADFTVLLPSLVLAAAVLRGAIARSPDDPDPTRAPTALSGAGFVVVVIGAAVFSGASGLARDALFEAREAAASGDGRGAYAGAARAVRLAPWDADANMAAAQTRERAGDGKPGAVALAEALADAEAAVAAAPVRPVARAVRGELRARAGDGPGAYADFTEAARLNPGRAEYDSKREALRQALSRPGPPR